MPVKPPPSKLSCPSCGWSKVVSPASDALIGGLDYFDECPDCANEELNSELVSQFEVSLERFKNIFKF